MLNALNGKKTYLAAAIAAGIAAATHASAACTAAAVSRGAIQA